MPREVPPEAHHRFRFHFEFAFWALLALAPLALPIYASAQTRVAESQNKVDLSDAEDLDTNCNVIGSVKDRELCWQARSTIAAERSANTAIAANQISGLGVILSFMSAVFVLVALRQTNKANKMTGSQVEEARKEAAALARDTASSLAQARRSADAALEAVKEASRSADAAVASNEIARIVLNDTKRAWLGKSAIVTTPVFDQLNGYAFRGFDVSVAWKNFGQTPAVNVSIKIYIFRFEGVMPNDAFPSFQDEETGIVLMPQDSILTGQMSISVAEFEDATAAKPPINLVMYSVVHYNDIFSDERRTSEVAYIMVPLTVKEAIVKGSDMLWVKWQSYGARNTST